MSVSTSSAFSGIGAMFASLPASRQRLVPREKIRRLARCRWLLRRRLLLRSLECLGDGTDRPACLPGIGDGDGQELEHREDRDHPDNGGSQPHPCCCKHIRPPLYTSLAYPFPGRVRTSSG